MSPNRKQPSINKNTFNYKSSFNCNKIKQKIMEIIIMKCKYY